MRTPTDRPPEIVICIEGSDDCTTLLGPRRADPALRFQAWVDAESRMDAVEGTTWVIAVVTDATGHRTAVAWAGARIVPEDGHLVLKCVDSYEVRPWRDQGIYELIHEAQHDAIVTQWPGDCVTYVFAGPRALYEARGWTVTDGGTSSDVPGHPHEWFELRRPGTPIVDPAARRRVPALLAAVVVLAVIAALAAVACVAAGHLIPSSHLARYLGATSILTAVTGLLSAAAFCAKRGMEAGRPTLDVDAALALVEDGIAVTGNRILDIDRKALPSPRRPALAAAGQRELAGG